MSKVPAVLTCVNDGEGAGHKSCTQQGEDFIESHVGPASSPLATPQLERHDEHGEDISGDDSAVEPGSKCLVRLVLGDRRRHGGGEHCLVDEQHLYAVEGQQ